MAMRFNPASPHLEYRIMERKSFKRRRYARHFIETQIESTLKTISRQQAADFLMLVGRFRQMNPVLDDLPLGGRANFHQSEMVLRALAQLLQDKRYWVRDLFNWRPSGNATFRNQFGSLARHLLATHDVPRFLDSAWWCESREARQHRKWFRHIGRGHGVLGLNIPGISDRLTAQRFLTAPAHLTVEKAITWAKHPEDTIRRPSYPCGPSRRRHKRLVAGKRESLWRRVGVKDFHFDEFREDCQLVWQIRQIRRAKDLIEEGKGMRHCVASYAKFCEQDHTSIWTMTCKICSDEQLPAPKERALTVEVLPERIVVQAKGYRNRKPRAHEIRVLKLWAEREGLKIMPSIAVQ